MSVSARKLLEILHETGECDDDCPECDDEYYGNVDDGSDARIDAQRDRELVPSLLDK